MLDDSTLDKPYSKFNALVYQHYSGKHKRVVSRINLISLLWTDGERAVPCDYRIYDKDTNGLTKNDHFEEMLMEAHQRGFNPRMVCFDSWYSLLDNLKMVRGLGWHFLTRLKKNRKVNPDREELQAIEKVEIGGEGRTVWLKGFGLIRVFRLIDKDGKTQYRATNKLEMNELERAEYALQSWKIEQYHRGIKQHCLIEKAQCRRRRPWQNHINLCLRAFLRLESHCYRTGISWFEAKTNITREAIRAYLKNPLYSLNPTA